MMNYTHFADIGLTLDKANNMNYRYSLPNKVFDYMHTATPVVATNVVEVARVVRENEIGEILEDFTVESLRATLDALLNDPEKLERYRYNCRKAAEVENWENECRVLAEIYPNVES